MKAELNEIRSMREMLRMLSRKIGEGEAERLTAVAFARGEDLAEVLARFGRDKLARAPKSFSKHMPALRATTFVEAGVRGGMAYVRMPNGRIFYGYTSRPNHCRAYEYVKDVISPILSEDTYLLGLDIAHRYESDFNWPSREIQPPWGGTVVECGAYLGHKTVRFADELVGKGGRVLAIEMMPDNAAVLRQNVCENGLENIIDVVECGVWKEAGELVVKGKERQRNTLVQLDKLQEDTGIRTRVDTLDSLLAKWGQPVADLIFVTVNGAEIEVIEGLNTAIKQVRAMQVAAPYDRDGRSNGLLCRELLEQKGFRVLETSTKRRLHVLGPGFVRCYREEDR